MGSVLTIENLKVSFGVYGGRVQAVRGLSLSIQSGEILALVGESGCGKSVTAQSVLGLNTAATAKMTADTLCLDGVDLLGATEKEMESLRGSRASMIFQDPLTCLNPTMKVGRQIVETLYRRKEMTATQCKDEAIRLLKLVQIPDAALRVEHYPHQFSGGMRQRIMIAMALACNPKLLIADEPTTALDVTIQLQILKLIAKIQKETAMAVLLITHDFGVVASLADRVAVMYAGKMVEEGSVATLFGAPAHPYTKGLLKSLPKPDSKAALTSIPGEPPDLFAPPKGCAFGARCEFCMNICTKEQPPQIEVSKGHRAACWRLHPAFGMGGNQ